MAVVELPGLGRSGADQARDLLAVEAGSLREVQAFRERLYEAGDADLVDHLGELARAGRPHEVDSRAVAFEKRKHAVVVLAASAGHDRQLAVLGPGLTPGYGRVHESKIALARAAVQFAREFGRSGGVIDQNRPAAHARKRAARFQRNSAHVLVATHAGERELRFRQAAAGLLAATPPYSSTQRSAVERVRLNTVTACPARARCPAIG